MKPCYFCDKLGKSDGTIALQSTSFGTICSSCLKEAIQFWKHHHDLGLLE